MKTTASIRQYGISFMMEGCRTADLERFYFGGGLLDEELRGRGATELVSRAVSEEDWNGEVDGCAPDVLHCNKGRGK